jgi:hypothetical protein
MRERMGLVSIIVLAVEIAVTQDNKSRCLFGGKWVYLARVSSINGTTDVLGGYCVRPIVLMTRSSMSASSGWAHPTESGRIKTNPGNRRPTSCKKSEVTQSNRFDLPQHQSQFPRAVPFVDIE